MFGSKWADTGPLGRTAFMIGGYLAVLLLWYMVTAGNEPMISDGILPSPGAVFSSYGEMLEENDLLPSIFYSLGLNMGGYIVAIALAIPLGFLLGLVIPIRLSAKGIVESLRYISLPAILGLFIAWFGIGSAMKIQFLAFGILIYLLPVVVQRIDEVREVYLKTVYTLGATNWQTIRTVYFPSVISRISDDIRVLTAISWTYIIISEAIGGEGGLGALIWRVGLRRGRLDKVFALLLIIVVIGLLQDRLLRRLDKQWFPHKYIERREHAVTASNESLSLILGYIRKVLGWIVFGILGVLLINELIQILPERYLHLLFQDTVWTLWLVFLGILGNIAYKYWMSKQFPYLNPKSDA